MKIITTNEGLTFNATEVCLGPNIVQFNIEESEADVCKLLDYALSHGWEVHENYFKRGVTHVTIKRSEVASIAIRKEVVCHV